MGELGVEIRRRIQWEQKNKSYSDGQNKKSIGRRRTGGASWKKTEKKTGRNKGGGRGIPGRKIIKGFSS